MVFSANITPQSIDVRFGPDHHCRVDLLQHATRLPEGNPVFVHRHGGAGMTKDKRAPWVTGGYMNVFANWLMQQTQLPVDFWSVSTPQSHWTTPTVAPHLATTFDERLTRPVLYPENVFWMKAFYQWANRHAVGGELVPELGATLGHRAGRFIACGQEFGALLQAVACFSGPTPPSTSAGQLIPGGRFAPYGTSSAVLGLVLLNPVVDVRNIGTLEQIYWGAMQGLFGTYQLGEWNSVPTWSKASASMLAYIERGETRHVVPQYLVGEALGNGLKPYGDPATGAGFDVRDAAQLTAYVAALDATVPVLPHSSEIIPVGDWETEVAGAALSQRVFDWARAVLGQ